MCVLYKPSFCTNEYLSLMKGNIYSHTKIFTQILINRYQYLFTMAKTSRNSANLN